MSDTTLSPEEAERIHEALTAMKGPDPALLPTIRRAAEFAEEGSDLWLMAHLRLAGHLVQPAEAGEALRCYGAVLRHVAGRGDRVERAAAVNFSHRALSAGREIEALAAARRAERLMREADDAPGTAVALHSIVAVLTQVHAWEEFEEAIARFEAAVVALPSPMRERSLRDVAASRADAASSRGDHETALRIVTEIEAGEYPPPPVWRLTFKAWLSAHLERFEEARGFIVEARAEGIEGWMRFPTDWADLVCLVAAGDSRGAMARAAGLLDWLDESARGEVGTGKRWIFSEGLAGTLARIPELAEMSHRAHDIAVGAALERMREVDRFFCDYPDYLRLCPEDARMIRGYRERLLVEQQALCARVARTLSAAVAEDALPRLATSGPEGLRAICAWCTRVRIEDGAWLPIGHLLPGTGEIALTHSICPDCKAEARREMQRESVGQLS